MNFAVKEDEDERFFAVIGPEHLDLPEGHRAYSIPELPDGDRACIPCLLCGDRALALLIYVEDLPRWTSSWTTRT